MPAGRWWTPTTPPGLRHGAPDDWWLSVTGLFWLKLGESRFGAGAANEIVLPGASTPEVAGTIELRADGTVFARSLPGSGVTLNGKPAGERPLRSDHAGGDPDTLHVGSVSLYVIDRGGKLAIRVKDANNPGRLRFKGIESFPIDASYRVQGTFEPYSAPRRVG